MPNVCLHILWHSPNEPKESVQETLTPANVTYTFISYTVSLDIRHFRMGGLQRTLEIGKGLHELSYILARKGTDGMPRAQVPDQAREEAFDCTYSQKREVRDIVAYAADEMPHFVPQIGP